MSRFLILDAEEPDDDSDDDDRESDQQSDETTLVLASRESLAVVTVPDGEVEGEIGSSASLEGSVSLSPEDDGDFWLTDAPPRRRTSGTVKVLIDGDGDILQPKLIRQGKEGGRAVADAMYKYLVNHCFTKRVHLPIPKHYLLDVFVNLEGFGTHLELNKFATKDQLKAFVQGFNSSRPMFYITDTGNEPQGADRAILDYWTENDDCHALFIGGLHDHGYLRPLLQLSPSARAKVTLLPTNDRALASYQRLGFPMMTDLQPLFLTQKRHPAEGACWRHYLAHCTDGSYCRFRHDVEPTLENIQEIARKREVFCRGRVPTLEEDLEGLSVSAVEFVVDLDSSSGLTRNRSKLQVISTRWATLSNPSPSLPAAMGQNGSSPEQQQQAQVSTHPSRLRRKSASTAPVVPLHKASVRAKSSVRKPAPGRSYAERTMAARERDRQSTKAIVRGPERVWEEEGEGEPQEEFGGLGIHTGGQRTKRLSRQHASSRYDDRPALVPDWHGSADPAHERYKATVAAHSQQQQQQQQRHPSSSGPSSSGYPYPPNGPPHPSDNRPHSNYGSLPVPPPRQRLPPVPPKKPKHLSLAAQSHSSSSLHPGHRPQLILTPPHSPPRHPFATSNDDYPRQQPTSPALDEPPSRWSLSSRGDVSPSPAPVSSFRDSSFGQAPAPSSPRISTKRYSSNNSFRTSPDPNLRFSPKPSNNANNRATFGAKKARRVSIRRQPVPVVGVERRQDFSEPVEEERRGSTESDKPLNKRKGVLRRASRRGTDERAGGAIVAGMRRRSSEASSKSLGREPPIPVVAQEPTTIDEAWEDDEDAPGSPRIQSWLLQESEEDRYSQARPEPRRQSSDNQDDGRWPQSGPGPQQPSQASYGGYAPPGPTRTTSSDYSPDQPSFVVVSPKPNYRDTFGAQAHSVAVAGRARSAQSSSPSDHPSNRYRRSQAPSEHSLPSPPTRVVSDSTPPRQPSFGEGSDDEWLASHSAPETQGLGFENQQQQQRKPSAFRISIAPPPRDEEDDRRGSGASTHESAIEAEQRRESAASSSSSHSSRNSSRRSSHGLSDFPPVPSSRPATTRSSSSSSSSRRGPPTPIDAPPPPFTKVDSRNSSFSRRISSSSMVPGTQSEPVPRTTSARSSGSSGSAAAPAGEGTPRMPAPSMSWGTYSVSGQNTPMNRSLSVVEVAPDTWDDEPALPGLDALAKSFGGDPYARNSRALDGADGFRKSMASFTTTCTTDDTLQSTISRADRLQSTSGKIESINTVYTHAVQYDRDVEHSTFTPHRADESRSMRKSSSEGNFSPEARTPRMDDKSWDHSSSSSSPQSLPPSYHSDGTPTLDHTLPGAIVGEPKPYAVEKLSLSAPASPNPHNSLSPALVSLSPQFDFGGFGFHNGGPPRGARKPSLGDLSPMSQPQAQMVGLFFDPHEDTTTSRFDLRNAIDDTPSTDSRESFRHPAVNETPRTGMEDTLRTFHFDVPESPAVRYIPESPATCYTESEFAPTPQITHVAVLPRRTDSTSSSQGTRQGPSVEPVPWNQSFATKPVQVKGPLPPGLMSPRRDTLPNFATVASQATPAPGGLAVPRQFKRRGSEIGPDVSLLPDPRLGEPGKRGFDKVEIRGWMMSARRESCVEGSGVGRP